MAKVIITETLFRDIEKRFSRPEANKVIDLIESLEKNPRKGKSLGHVAEFLIKEIRYKSFRFYFILDGRMLRFGTEDNLLNLLIRFVRMSNKKEQQKTIDEIKDLLRHFRIEDF